MGKVLLNITMSLDGFIARPDDGSERPLGDGGERLLKWFFSGDTDYVVPSGGMTFKVSKQSADLLRETFGAIEAIVTGRRTFDIANGWDGRHPVDVPVVVVTHTVPHEWVKEGRRSRSLRTASKAPARWQRKPPVVSAPVVSR